MHIFNLNNKPYLIISSKELLFRQNDLNEEMQRIPFTHIKKISLEHRYSPDKELFVWLSVQTTTQSSPYLIQISILNESLEETFNILQEELHCKTKLVLPKNTKLTKLRTHNKAYKRLSFLSVLLLLSLLIYHKFVFPPLDTIQIGATQIAYQDAKGACSTNIKLAYASKNKKYALVKTYCGLFGFWKLKESKQVPLKYLSTEFQSHSAKDWVDASRILIKDKHYKKAAVGLEKALYLQPENENNQVLLSKVYNLQGEHKKSLILAKQIVERHPSFALGHENLAFLYQEDNNLSQSLIHFKTSSRLSPKASTYMALAMIQDEQNLKEESLANYQKALVLSPNNTYLLTALGLAYWENKEFTKAKDSLQKAYTLEPTNPACFLNYYEVSLVTKAEISPEQKEEFLKINKDDRTQMMVYEMLEIIEASIQKKEDPLAKENWKEKYQDQELDWSFFQIRAWLDDSSLEIDHLQDIQRTLGFFIGHQQAFNMKFNTIQEAH